MIKLRSIRSMFALAVLLFLSTHVSAQIPKGDITIRLEPVAAGLTAPVQVTHAGDAC